MTRSVSSKTVYFFVQGHTRVLVYGDTTDHSTTRRDRCRASGEVSPGWWVGTMACLEWYQLCTSRRTPCTRGTVMNEWMNEKLFKLNWWDTICTILCPCAHVFYICRCIMFPTEITYRESWISALRAWTSTLLVSRAAQSAPWNLLGKKSTVQVLKVLIQLPNYSKRGRSHKLALNCWEAAANCLVVR